MDESRADKQSIRSESSQVSQNNGGPGRRRLSPVPPAGKVPGSVTPPRTHSPKPPAGPPPGHKRTKTPIPPPTTAKRNSNNSPVPPPTHRRTASRNKIFGSGKPSHKRGTSIDGGGSLVPGAALAPQKSTKVVTVIITAPRYILAKKTPQSKIDCINKEEEMLRNMGTSDRSFFFSRKSNERKSVRIGTPPGSAAASIASTAKRATNALRKVSPPSSTAGKAVTEIKQKLPLVPPEVDAFAKSFDKSNKASSERSSDTNTTTDVNMQSGNNVFMANLLAASASDDNDSVVGMDNNPTSSSLSLSDDDDEEEESNQDSIVVETTKEGDEEDGVEGKLDDAAPEEAAAVVKDEEQEELFVNVEELLRFHIQEMLDQWHLFCSPTYSYCSEHRSTEGDNWIRVEVVAKQSSLGIVMDRLGRVGVGTAIGTINFVASELCQTASPWAHQPEPPRSRTQSEDVQSLRSNSERSDSSDGDKDEKEALEKEMEEERKLQAEQERIIAERNFEEGKKEFMNVASRLIVEKVKDKIKASVSFGFDDWVSLIVAGGLAAIGLASNNSVILVASMLVSPIMGPVLGMTFGTSTRDWNLFRHALYTETIALVVCILIGASVTVFMAALTPIFSDAARDWPTAEMESRGEYLGLLSGIAVAIFSGCGVGISVLNENNATLIGVAISASLLPPAVNSGMCFAYGFLLMAGVFANREDDRTDFFVLGGVSLLLTIVNILCVWITGIVIFRIKEVRKEEEDAGAFWQTGLKDIRENSERGLNIKVLENGAAEAISKKKGVKPDHVKITPPVQKFSLDTSMIHAARALNAKQRRTNPLGLQLLAELSSDRLVPQGKKDKEETVALDDLAELFGFNQYTGRFM